MEDAKARRERLKALKQAAELAGGANADGAAADSQEPAPEPEKPVLKFRNYQIKDQSIAAEQVRVATAECRGKCKWHCCVWHGHLRPELHPLQVYERMSLHAHAPPGGASHSARATGPRNREQTRGR